MRENCKERGKVTDSQSNCCYEDGQDGDEAMFITPWKRQPCRELRENHACLDSLDEKANDTGTEKVGASFSGGARGCHDAQFDNPVGLTHPREGESKSDTREALCRGTDIIYICEEVRCSMSGV
jgi:hypothetical protein